jgi:hypothetical protein
MNDSRLYPILAMAGVTPFLACAVMPLVGLDEIGTLGPLNAVVAGYGLAIVSFLTGIHWATRIYDQQQSGFNLLIVSNIVFVAVWLAFVLGTVNQALLAQAGALLVLLAIDRWLLSGGVISSRYYRTRRAATVLAVLSLTVVILTA